MRRRPDVVVVQGDTTSTFCGALAAFYSRTPVAHVEAGLRTDQPDSPFPEEMNRRLSTRLAGLHLAATEWAANNLLAEGVAAESIRVTGNPGIDALLSLRATQRQSPTRRVWAWRDRGKRLITITAHRRESFGHGLQGICEAVETLAQRQDVQMAWPLHPNPDVRRIVLGRLSVTPNISLLPPLDYADFIDLLAGSDLTLTDSGGVQEEAPSVGTPALVLRETTERRSWSAVRRRRSSRQPGDCSTTATNCTGDRAFTTPTATVAPHRESPPVCAICWACKSWPPPAEWRQTRLRPYNVC